MYDLSDLDPEKVRLAAERHGYSCVEIQLVVESLRRNTVDKPSGILDGILKAPPRLKSQTREGRA